MNGITLLILVLSGGYIYNINYPVEKKTKMYFGGGCILFFIFIYFMNYQKPFVYKMAKNIKDIQTQPLHTIVPEYNINNTSSANIKFKIADKQGLRCPNCRNPIILEEIQKYKLSYIVPLQYGGNNEPSNLKLLCPNCFAFKNY
jgi:hypothetical protein